MKVWIRWTAADDMVMRRLYVIGGVDACLAALPNRSATAIYLRAQRLGLKRYRRWTAHEWMIVKTSLREIGLTAVAKKIGRSPEAVWWYASKHKLGTGRTQGYEYLGDAAKRCGYSPTQLRRILAGRVHIIAVGDRQGRIRPNTRKLVDPVAVTETVAAYVRGESC